MVNSWYMVADNNIKDQRQPNQLVPPQPVSIDKLKELGVLYHKIESDNYDKDDKLNQIREKRGYTYSDQITCSKEKLPNYEEKLKMFFTEHIHSDEEIRLCTDGSGYFDVRDKDDRWIRIELEKGDLIILPAGIYHRFTMDENFQVATCLVMTRIESLYCENYIEAKRYFVGEPVWTPINRPADDHEARKIYVKTIEA